MQVLWFQTPTDQGAVPGMGQEVQWLRKVESLPETMQQTQHQNKTREPGQGRPNIR